MPLKKTILTLRALLSVPCTHSVRARPPESHYLNKVTSCGKIAPRRSDLLQSFHHKPSPARRLMERRASRSLAPQIAACMFHLPCRRQRLKPKYLRTTGSKTGQSKDPRLPETLPYPNLLFRIFRFRISSAFRKGAPRLLRPGPSQLSSRISRSTRKRKKALEIPPGDQIHPRAWSSFSHVGKISCQD